MSPPPTLQPGATVADRYTLVGRLGRGATADVWRVLDATDGEERALKVLHVRQRELESRLRVEGRVLAALDHPNVVRVHDVLDLPEGVALVLDLVRGPSLAQLLVRSGALGPAHADELAAGLFAGLAAAHAAGLVHRDLKPANVLIDVTPDGRPVPRLADFGVAKVLGGAPGTRSLTGMMVGTPAYMAPEQARDSKHVDHRVDVWALGAVLYRAVTGRNPFDGQGFWEVYEAVQAGRFRPPEVVRPDLPPRQARAIREALRLDPAERPAAVGALAALWTEGGVAAPEPWSAAWLAPAPEEEPPPPPVPPPPPRTEPVPAEASPARRPLPRGLLPAALAALGLAGLAVALRPDDATVRLEVVGGAPRVLLVGSGGAFSLPTTGPVSLPAGGYEVHAAFAEAPAEVVAVVHLEPRAHRVITCDATARTCATR